MGSGFFGIELGSRALQAFQTAMDVAGHNIANVNTRGYSRQRIAFTPTSPETGFGRTPFQLGTGVNVDSITRVRDLFLEQRYRSVNSESSRFGTMSQSLQQVQALFGAAGDKGLGTKIDAFFNAFQDLSANPDSQSARQAVRDAGASLAASFHSLDSGLYQANADLTTQIEGKIGQINDLSRQIADLNKQIGMSVSAGGSPNDLMDQRDALVEQLSGIVDVDVRPAPNGAVNVFIGSQRAVWADDAFALPTTVNLATMTLGSGPQAVSLGSGELAGLVQSQARVQAYRDSLNSLASTIITRVNAVHQAGMGTNGATNIAFFDGAGARDIDLSAAIKADLANIAAGTTGAAGDGSQALALARLRDEQQAGLGNLTMTAAFAGLASSVGGDVKQANAGLDAQGAVLDQLDAMRQSDSGVSLDEEMANMMRFQRSYQAAAHLVSVADQMLQDLIQQLGG